MTGESERYWFQAKRYGWGWGLPATWQGWLLLAGYVAVVAGGVAGLDGEDAVLLTVAASGILVAVCVWKGEPARWRWGRR